MNNEHILFKIQLVQLLFKFHPNFVAISLQCRLVCVVVTKITDHEDLDELV
jgi:hypothetical protein